MRLDDFGFHGLGLDDFGLDVLNGGSVSCVHIRPNLHRRRRLPGLTSEQALVAFHALHAQLDLAFFLQDLEHANLDNVSHVQHILDLANLVVGDL